MKSHPPPDNPLLSLVLNIILPVLILNKGSHFLNPYATLGIALCFPLSYGVQDYVRHRHKNYVSLVGTVNILLTGSLAALSLNGIWFAFKDASLPFVLGLLVLGSAWSATPAASIMFCNPHVMNMTLIDEKLGLLGQAQVFDRILRKTTIWLSMSFFLSAIANFILAYHVFEDIDTALPKEEQLKVLNSQIAHMTWLGFGMIALPLMVFSSILIYVFLRRLSQLIDVPIDGLMKP